MTKLHLTIFASFACVVAIVGAADLPMHPFGSETIWKVSPFRDDHVLTNALKSSWGNCSSTTISTVLSITADPDPVVKGSVFSIYAKVRLAQELTGGKLTAIVRYLGIKIAENNYNICDAAMMAGYSCPVPSGLLDIVISSSISNSAPTGTYTVKITATDQYDQDAACVKLYLSVASQYN